MTTSLKKKRENQARIDSYFKPLRPTLIRRKTVHDENLPPDSVTLSKKRQFGCLKANLSNKQSIRLPLRDVCLKENALTRVNEKPGLFDQDIKKGIQRVQESHKKETVIMIDSDDSDDELFTKTKDSIVKFKPLTLESDYENSCDDPELDTVQKEKIAEYDTEQKVVLLQQEIEEIDKEDDATLQSLEPESVSQILIAYPNPHGNNLLEKLGLS